MSHPSAIRFMRPCTPPAMTALDIRRTHLLKPAADREMPVVSGRGVTCAGLGA